MAAASRKLQIRIGLILGAMILVYGCYALIPNKFQALDVRLVDRLFVVRAKQEPFHHAIDDRIVHIDANLYFSRSQHAHVFRNLSDLGIAAQLIDFIFEEMVSQEEDQPLIQATRQAGNVYYGLAFESLDDSAVGNQVFSKISNHPETLAVNWRVDVTGNSDSVVTGTRPRVTYPDLSSVARGLGFLNLAADPDGTLRRVPLLVRYQGTYVPSLSLRIVCDYLGITADNIVASPGRYIKLRGLRTSDHVTDSEITIPLDKRGHLILNNSGFVDGLRHYSYSEIFHATEDTASLEKLRNDLSGKIAVISETVEKKFQIRTATGKGFYPSGAIHAMVLQNLLSGSYLRELPGWVQLGIEITMLAGLFLLSMRFSSAPLALTSGTLGVLYMALAVVTFLSAGIIFQFARPIVLLLTAMTFLLIGLGIEKAVLFARSERARRIAERDLEIGREIQSGFFPTALPETAGWELATHFQAARHVAGDFYDIFTLGRDNKIAIVIADVCDKGVGAALFMALFRSFIRVLSGSVDSSGHLDTADGKAAPEKILRDTFRSINNYISITHEQAGMFATIFYGILDPQTGALTYINGGHEPPIITGSNGKKNFLEPTGPAVGLYPDLDFDVRSLILKPNDMLLAYTDGVTDSRNPAGDAFTKEQLVKMVGNSSGTAKDLIHKIKSRIEDHILGADQFDDVTLVALRRQS